MAELKFTAFTGIATVSAFSIFFVPHWSAVLYIFPFMCILYVNLLGLFQMTGLSINVLTYVVLVVSVGLLVDFIMHVLLRYFESKKATRKEKVKDTLETMGFSILLGGASTFLGTVPLIFSKSMVFRTMCTAFFSMVGLGVSHGLLLLPVLLSIFGSTSGESSDGDSSNNGQDISPTSWMAFLKTRDAGNSFKQAKGDDQTSRTSGLVSANSGDSLAPSPESSQTLTPSPESSQTKSEDSLAPSPESSQTKSGQDSEREEGQLEQQASADSASDDDQDYQVSQMCRSSDTFEQWEIFV